MARLLPLLLFFGFAIFMAVLRQPGRREPRDPRAYRPRTRTRSGFSAGKRHGKASHTLRRADLVGLRDAYSGEPLDPDRPLVRCTGCGVLYHAESAAVLARENGGRCAACGRTDFRAVMLVES
jgi:hypothetical protein